ncbi:MAG TPA: CHAD domain-containing protein [Pyrinomonadaceae bacterium]|nr:CHAD domain-containing protein [Pyrinomonadaceae bacterium]
MAKAKRIKGIKCNDAAAAGIRLVLTTRFEEMFDFQEAALDFSDPEGVHSMRVASRRLRSAMRDFMPYIRKRGLASLLKQTKSIASALGEVRDQDVAIAALEKIEKRAPAEASAALKQLIETRKAARDEARKRLKSALVPTHMKQLRTEFIAGIDGATPLRKTPARNNAPVTYIKMSADVIGERLKELEALSNSLYKPFEVESLHEMRIAAKRFRYALELFQQCWGRALTGYAKSAAQMQKALGDLHDCDIWIDSIGEQVNEARKKKHDDQIEGLIWLLSHFVKLRTKHLRQAYDLWREWEAKDLGDQLRQTFQSPASE